MALQEFLVEENRDIIRRLNAVAGQLSPEDRTVLAAMKRKHRKIVVRGIRRRRGVASADP